MKDFFRLIRYENLLMIVLMQLVFRYGFLQLSHVPSALLDWQYVLLILSTICIAAAGYIINDIYDQDTDRMNRPTARVVGTRISEGSAYNFYIGLNVVGVGIGFYLSNLIGKPGFAMIFIAVAGTLYLYSASLKQIMLLGNLVIAVLSAFSIVLVGIFDLYPAITPQNNLLMGTVFKVLLDYAMFCFIISFIRELVKDLEDVNGDYNAGMNTLPIALGVTRVVNITFALSFVPIITLLYYINKYYIANDLYIGASFTLLMVVGPLIYFTIKCRTARTSKEFHTLSQVLKFVLLAGIISVVIITLNIKMNA